MKRRRKKSGLSGSAEQHSYAQSRHLSLVEGRIRMADREVHRGYCGEAADHLRLANRHLGGFNAESEWSGKKSPIEAEVRKNLKDVTDRFEERCLINFAK